MKTVEIKITLTFKKLRFYFRNRISFFFKSQNSNSQSPSLGSSTLQANRCKLNHITKLFIIVHTNHTVHKTNSYNYLYK